VASSPYHLQKFRAYLLEQDKSMDILAYLLCYFLDIKDRPGKELKQYQPSLCPDAM